MKRREKIISNSIVIIVDKRFVNSRSYNSMYYGTQKFNAIIHKGSPIIPILS